MKSEMHPKRPNILDEYDWLKVKKKMDEDGDGDIWHNIGSHIVSTEHIYNSSENLFRAIMQQVNLGKGKFEDSYSENYLSENRPQILNGDKKEWKEVQNDFNADVWFEILQYTKTIEVLYENMHIILTSIIPELYQSPEKGNSNGNDTEKL